MVNTLASHLNAACTAEVTKSTPLLLTKPTFSPFFNSNVTVANRSTILPRNSVHLKSSTTICNSSKQVTDAAAAATSDSTAASKVKAVAKVMLTVGGLLTNIGITRGLDDIGDLLGKTMTLELVSTEVDSRNGLQKEPLKAYAHKIGSKDGYASFEADFVVPAQYGQIGAILIENEHHKEMYIQSIELQGLPMGTLNFTCNSWVHSKFDNPQKRVFFADKESYLPSQTPDGLKSLREKELESIRGTGEGERKSFERIYDYDTYNDLGNPDSDVKLKRPVLGGSKELPYPRRCRTGRPRCKTDPLSEQRSSSVYVPRDEQFSDVKELTFSAKTVYSVLHAVIPSLETTIVDSNLGFPFFRAIEDLYNEGIHLPSLNKNGIKDFLPNLIKSINDVEHSVLKFETPSVYERDRFSWFDDDEFGRQTLAGLNPCSIKLVTEWPIKSSLDPNTYGPAESAITTEVVQKLIGGIMTVEEAVKQKKLFLLDYYDVFLPYVKKVRELDGTTLYGSRTLFFLLPEGTLRPIAIELCRPPYDGKPFWREVYTPIGGATNRWLWRLAKAHVLAHDSGYHQLISHWLRTHCCVEPYIIAASRQLSAMHPIYRLLHPHFRYTLEINALAREALINAGGIIESAFTPGKYSIEISSVIYGSEWQFDLQALPADLINRGMAVEDPSSPHGLKLTITDYPFANDGLLLWDIIKQWVTDYVTYYYPDSASIQSDQEVLSWWDEIRTKGHADKKDEPWWPVLKTPEDLIGIITTIIWITSGHHAAVNFGQYGYAGYFPNRPTTARINMPTEEPSEDGWKFFLEKPEVTLLQCLPSQVQATKVMAVLDVLSSHSPDEEYLGEKPEPTWGHNPVIKAAFEQFQGRLKELEGIVDAKNEDRELRNRCGAGVVPYELLKPISKPGVTGMGVPNSISI